MDANPTLKALIAEDNSLMRASLDIILKDCGVFEVLHAQDGVQAVETFRNKKPNMVFLDINMPRKDGLAALTEIRELDANAYVVMVSAHSSAEFLKAAIAAGAKSFIVKPYNIKRIADVMKNYMTSTGRSS
jgi:two-component system, chemotaxis family, chemotaxis protein CheY